MHNRFFDVRSNESKTEEEEDLINDTINWGILFNGPCHTPVLCLCTRMDDTCEGFGGNLESDAGNSIWKMRASMNTKPIYRLERQTTAINT